MFICNIIGSNRITLGTYNCTFLPVHYLRQVNEVNGGDNALVRCVCLSVCVCAAAGQWELNANSSKTVKATDVKFDIHVPRDSPDMTPKKFFQKGAWRGYVTPEFLGIKC